MCGVPVVRGDDLLADCVGVTGKMEVEERHAQKSYWEEHSKDLTVEAMMLDSRAADLDKEERPEVIHSAMTFSPLPLSIPVFSEYTTFSVLFSAFCDPSPWIWEHVPAFAPRISLGLGNLSKGTYVETEACQRVHFLLG